MPYTVKNMGSVGERFSTDANGESIVERIAVAVKNAAGGRSIKTLIEEGRIVNAKGEPYKSEDKQFTYSDEGISNEERAAIIDVAEGGVFILDPDNGNRPRHIYAEQKNREYELFMSSPLDKKDLKDYTNQIAFTAVNKAENDGVERPGFFNRLVDGISRFFGGEGTPEMNEWREHLDNLSAAKDKASGYRSSVEKLEDTYKGIQNRTNLIDKALTPERLGYDKGSFQYKVDKEVIDSFFDQLKEASKEPKINRLIVSMGAGGGSGNALKALFGDFKEKYQDGHPMDVKGLLTGATKTAEPNGKESEMDVTRSAHNAPADLGNMIP